jgi:bacterioferritin-associated ferredoxin
MAAEPAERLVCACFGLTDRIIIDAFQRCNSSYDALVQQTKVGTKCTACLLDLDLLLDGVVRREARPAGASAAARRGLFIKAEDQCHCGHFVNCDGITTVLRVANHGLMFGADSQIVPHDYRLVVLSTDGRTVHRRSGRLRAGATLDIRFSDVSDLPGSGWFIIDLLPRGRGVVGSLRPQIGIIGPHWVATFHPQWLSFRTRRRAVLAAIEDGRPDLWPVLINPHNAAVELNVALLGIDTEFRSERRMEMGARSRAEIDLAPLAAPAFTGTALCAIEASRPIMFYIINKHRDGTWCVDHFPNEK